LRKVGLFRKFIVFRKGIGGWAIPRFAGRPNTDRNRLKRIEPLWPVSALTPFSRCPHGVLISIDRVCGICHKAARPTQDEIDAMPVPPPTNPEDRALREIDFLLDWLASHPRATTRMKTHIVKQVTRLEATVREFIPTKYMPRTGLKGGVS
jgi:hypothetical protein